MGNVDIYHSRRTNYAECKYWTRNEKVGSPESWILNHTPSGKFYAKEISPKYNQFGQLGNVFGYDINGITLETDDDVYELERGCLVLYNGHCWTVENVQYQVHRKESQFSQHIDYKYIISIRR